MDGSDKHTVHGGTVRVVAADITTLSCDAIVNAANEQLAPGGGVCGAIHRAAGPGLARECKVEVESSGPCPTGSARLTRGYKLPARYVIHAVGPVWHGGGRGEPDHLAGCYKTALDLGATARCASIAFPAISTGIFGYPPAPATEVAVSTCATWLSTAETPMDITFCCFGDDMLALYRKTLAALQV